MVIRAVDRPLDWDSYKAICKKIVRKMVWSRGKEEEEGNFSKRKIEFFEGITAYFIVPEIQRTGVTSIEMFLPIRGAVPTLSWRAKKEK